MSRLTLDAIVATAGGRRFGPLSATLAPGDRLALVGPSGTGKTTLLRAIAGLLPITTGALRVDDTDISAWPPERRHLAYLHQTPRLFPHLDVLGNVALPRRVAGDPVAAAEAQRWLGAVQLATRATAAVDTLSGGERQRVALARALASQPRALLLDEPFSALDPSLRREVREVVEQLLDAEGPAAILVTHDLEEAASFASRVVTLLPDGSSWAGELTTLMHRPPTVGHARFVGIENLVAPALLGVQDSPDVVLVGCRASAIEAVRDTTGAWQVERSRPAETGYRVDLRSSDGAITASAPAPLAAGERVRLAVDTPRVLRYGADGFWLSPG